ncbi:MAG: PAS domain-containing protein, partial [Alphaproteobacteria bacterium]
MRLREWFTRGDDAQDTSLTAHLDAANRSLAIIEFDPDGAIRSANENFLAAMGYDLAEVVGRHHRIFVDPAEAASPAYEAFWQNLRAGKFASAQYRRFAKGGREIWLQATYNPLIDSEGAVTGVVKFATDITEQKRAAAEAAGKLTAISRAQAMIEFTLDGNILDANENLLNDLGFGIEEIRGQHHRMFVEKAYADSAEYQEFWAALARGQFQADEFKRFGKGGKAVWIQASYNPIFDSAGRPVKVVKFATDITAQKT